MNIPNEKKKSLKPEFNLASVLANTTLRKQLEGFVEEITLKKGEQKTAALAIKDIVGEAKDSIGIPGKILNKLVRERMNPGALEEEADALDEALRISDGLGYSDSLGNNARAEEAYQKAADQE